MPDNGNTWLVIKSNLKASQTSLTWQAPVAGNILVAPGVASIMRSWRSHVIRSA
jgi:hypothetical protein